MNAPPDLSIIIVNHNTRDFLRDCLRSVFDNGYSGPFEVFVVDNHSGDESAGMVKRTFPAVRLIENGTNVGFSRANNRALRMCRGRFALLLNPDTRVLPRALDALVAFMNERSDAGAAGARQWLDPDKTFQSVATARPLTRAVLWQETPLLGRLAPRRRLLEKYWEADFRLWRAERPVEVEALNGSCLIVRLKILEDIGDLDERFFLFFEDIDWCLRMRKGGWKIFFVPQAEIVHYGMRAVLRAGGAQEILAASKRHYIKKHMGGLTCLFWSTIQRAAQRISGLARSFGQGPGGGRTVARKRFRPDQGDIRFGWKDVPEADGYNLELSDHKGFLYKAGTQVKQAECALPPFLRQSFRGGRYYWRVAPIGREGRLGRFSRARVFFA